MQRRTDMPYLFFVFVFCAIVAIPIHFRSVEHTKLQKRHGKDKGTKIGEVYGRLSGYMLFLSLMGLWFSPQPRFTIPILRGLSVFIPGTSFSIPLVHFVVFMPFFVFGVLYLSQSVSGLTRKVSEAHHPDEVVTTGIYARVRHPQYLGFLLMHSGFVFLLSGLFALLSTPLIFVMLYFFARKEELELTKDFGSDYDVYKRKVPMLIPKIH
jgi:protein-S-isoprenylcysteine O-methyltransferase Ste14